MKSIFSSGEDGLKRSTAQIKLLHTIVCHCFSFENERKMFSSHRLDQTNSSRFSLFVVGSQEDGLRAPVAPTVTAAVLFSPRPLCATMAAL